MNSAMARIPVRRYPMKLLHRSHFKRLLWQAFSHFTWFFDKEKNVSELIIFENSSSKNV